MNHFFFTDKLVFLVSCFLFTPKDFDWQEQLNFLWVSTLAFCISFYSTLKDQVVLPLVLCCQCSSPGFPAIVRGALSTAYDYPRHKHTKQKQTNICVVSLGADSGQSMLSQSSCSSGKSPAWGRGRCWLQSDFSTGRYNTVWSPHPALLRRREGCTLTSKELPAGSPLPGVCLGHDHVLCLERPLPPFAQGGLCGAIQSSSLEPSVPRTGAAASLKPCFTQCGCSQAHFGWKTPNTGRSGWTEWSPHHCSPCHPPYLALRDQQRWDSWGTLGLNRAEDRSAPFSRVSLPPWSQLNSSVLQTVLIRDSAMSLFSTPWLLES